MAEKYRYFSYQPDLIDSLVLFMFFGLHPGSLGESLLLQDFEGSLARAHFNLKKQVDGEYIYIRDMIDLTNLLIPEYIRDSKKTIFDWCETGGFKGSSKDMKDRIMRDIADHQIIDDIISQYITMFY